MMTARMLRRLGAAAIVVALGGAAFARVTRPARTPVGTAMPRATGFSERAERDVQIRVWHQALDADPTSAIVTGQLAALHLQRAREGGGWDDYLKAETFARQSVGKRTKRNSAASSTLVSILLAQHRFTEAREIAEALVRAEPEVPAYRAALAEVAMELGDYAAADTLFRSVWSERGTLTTAARLARWLELNNHVPEARRLLITARADALSRRDVARETQAWFHLRVGDLDLRRGRLDDAAAAFTAGLTLEPDDPRLLAAMARYEMARRNWREAIAWGERAIAIQLDPATLGLIGDAYGALGNRSKADEYSQTLEVAVSLQPGAYHRAWSLHLLEHGLQVGAVLAKAMDELRDRKDVYGYDIVALGLEKSGRHAEAQAAMREALRLQTPDPLLERHARELGVTTAVTAAP
jgi:tetratricopeptide (TPR) repeat protein